MKQNTKRIKGTVTYEYTKSIYWVLFIEDVCTAAIASNTILTSPNICTTWFCNCSTPMSLCMESATQGAIVAILSDNYSCCTTSDSNRHRISVL